MKAQPIVLFLAACNIALLLVLVARPLAEAEPAVAPVVRAQAFELVDAQGQVRSRLTLEAGGEAVFRLLDESGTIRVKIGADADGSGIVLLDERTEPGIQMLAEADGGVIRLSDGAGVTRELTAQE